MTFWNAFRCALSVIPEAKTPSTEAFALYRFWKVLLRSVSVLAGDWRTSRTERASASTETFRRALFEMLIAPTYRSSRSAARGATLSKVFARSARLLFALQPRNARSGAVPALRETFVKAFALIRFVAATEVQFSFVRRNSPDARRRSRNSFADSSTRTLPSSANTKPVASVTVFDVKVRPSAGA